MNVDVTLDLILLVIAAVAFGIAAFARENAIGRVSLVPFGLMLVAIALI